MTDNLGGAPAPAPEPAGAPAAAPAPAPAGESGRDWLPTEYHTDPVFKNFQSPAELAKSYQNAAKLVGLDKNEVVVRKPKEGAPQPEWDAYYAALGRPADAKGYKAPTIEGVTIDPAEMVKIQEAAFKAGMPENMFAPMLEAFAAIEKESAAAEAERFANQRAQSAETLRAQWGEAYDARLVDVTNALDHYAGSPEKASELKAELKKMGAEASPTVMAFLAEAGKSLREMPGYSGGSASGGNAALTPTEAKLMVNEKMADPAFKEKYLKGDPAAIAEMQRLNNYAYPEAKR